MTSESLHWRTNRRSLLALTAAPLLAAFDSRTAEAAPSSAEDWAQWRGPLNTGVSNTATPPTKWTATENVRWKAKLPGSGTGSPIVWKDRIYLQAAVLAQPTAAGAIPADPVKFELVCLDRKDGKVFWEKVLREEVPHEGHHQDHGYASHSPITDGELMITLYGSRGLYCTDLDGNVKWKKDLGKQRTRNGFGEGSSPALHGKVVVVNWDHEGEDFVVALNRDTGDEMWRQPRTEPTSWATPLVVEHEGKAQVVVSATQRIRSYDLMSGKQLWECGGMTVNVIPSPVSGHGMLYATSGFRGNALLAIKLGREGDLTGTDAIAWSHNRSTPYVPSPLLYEDKIYFLGGNNPILSCFNAKTGQPLINAERLEGLIGVYASPVGAAGKVYVVGRNGTTAVLKHGEKLEVLATNVLGEKVDASPALVGKDLLIRGHEHLYCFAEG